MKKTTLIAGVFAAVMAFGTTGCSGLFDPFSEDENGNKSGGDSSQTQAEKIYVYFDSDEVTCKSGIGSRWAENVSDGGYVEEGDYVGFTSNKVDVWSYDPEKDYRVISWTVNGNTTVPEYNAKEYDHISKSDAVVEDGKYVLHVSVKNRKLLNVQINFDETKVSCTSKLNFGKETAVASGDYVAESSSLHFYPVNAEGTYITSYNTGDDMTELKSGLSNAGYVYITSVTKNNCNVTDLENGQAHIDFSFNSRTAKSVVLSYDSTKVQVQAKAYPSDSSAEYVDVENGKVLYEGQEIRFRNPEDSSALKGVSVNGTVLSTSFMELKSKKDGTFCVLAGVNGSAEYLPVDDGSTMTVEY